MKIVAISNDGYKTTLLCQVGDSIVEKKFPIGILHTDFEVDDKFIDKLLSTHTVNTYNVDRVQAMQDDRV